MENRYIILQTSKREVLVELVNKKIEEGYIPLGGVCFVPSPNTFAEGGYYAQAVFKA